jgi:hypothetical protein
MIGFLVNTLGKWKLRKLVQANKRIPQAINLESIESAILVFDITNNQDYNEITGFASYLRRQEGLSSVKMVAYYSGKEKPSFVDENAILVFGNKECNAFGIPNQVEFDFKVQFDLLVDFTSDSLVPTNYFLGQVNAKTFVGKGGTEKEEWFDLIIDIPVDSGISMYKENILRYLKMINKA